MPSDQTRTRSAQLKLFIAIVVWGGSFIATKVVVQEVAPITVIWLRFLIGWLILGGFAWRRGQLELPSWKEALEFAWLGFLGITLHQWLQSYGLVTSQASTTAWIVSTTPVFMALMGWMFLKEKLGLASIGGILAATLGVLLVVSKGHLAALWAGGLSQPGDVLVLISAINWGVYSVAARPVLQRHSALKVTFYSLLFGWLLSSIQFVAGAHWSEIGQLSVGGWGNILYLGILCSALANIFYNDGLQILPTSHVGAFLYLEPLVATLVAAALLAEQIVLATVLGGGLILLGVWLVNREGEGAGTG